MANGERFFQLNTGVKMPAIGLGTWQIAPDQVPQVLESAIHIGYRHLDCAPVYNNEKEIGSALHKLFQENVIKREELFIASKLWNADHGPEDVALALERSLQDLQLEYMDLFLIHWPVRLRKGAPFNKPEGLIPADLVSTWRAMEALYDSGKARAIGVSNFSTKKLKELMDIARVPPAVNQVEGHPLWQQKKLREFCEANGVHLSAYSTLGSPGTPWIKAAGNVLEDPEVISVAEKLGKSAAQVALRWALQMGYSVLPKSANEERLRENFDIFDWSIPDELLAKLDEIKQVRLVKAEFFIGENGPYKSLEEFWDGEV